MLSQDCTQNAPRVLVLHHLPLLSVFYPGVQRFRLWLADLLRKISQWLEGTTSTHQQKDGLDSFLLSLMNAHFLFGVLNSIQYYILRNNKENALRFLTSYSEVIRHALDRVGEQTITLQADIDFIDEYIQFEMFRLEYDFEYVIDIDEKVNLSSIRIPPMLLQPFVENAILHGLNHDVPGRSLQLKVIKTPMGVSITIADNGVGRDGSEAGSSKIHKHKPISASVTEMRLMRWNKKNKSKISIDISSNPCSYQKGTKVTIDILPSQA